MVISDGGLGLYVVISDGGLGLYVVISDGGPGLYVVIDLTQLSPTEPIPAFFSSCVIIVAVYQPQL